MFLECAMNAMRITTNPQTCLPVFSLSKEIPFKEMLHNLFEYVAYKIMWF